MKQTFIEFLQEGDVMPFPKKNNRPINQNHRSGGPSSNTNDDVIPFPKKNKRHVNQSQNHRSGGLSSITDDVVDHLFDQARVQTHYSVIHKEFGGLHIEIGFPPHTRHSIQELEEIATEVMTDEYPTHPYKVENEGDIDNLVVHLHYKL